MQWGFMPEEPSVEWTVTKRRRRAIISGTFSVTRETTTCGEIMIFFFVWWGAVVEQEVRSLNSSKEEQYLCSPNEVKSKLFPLFNQFCVIATSFLLVCRLKPAYLGCGTWLYFYRHIYASFNGKNIFTAVIYIFKYNTLKVVQFSCKCTSCTKFQHSWWTPNVIQLVTDYTIVFSPSPPQYVHKRRTKIPPSDHRLLWQLQLAAHCDGYKAVNAAVIPGCSKVILSAL